MGVGLCYRLTLYYIFLAAILLSDILFLLGVVGLVKIDLPGPYNEVWVLAFALFCSEVTLALSREEGEDSLVNILLVALSYFTYCQLWIPVVCKGFYDDFVMRKARIWAKTERYEVSS